MYFPLGENFTNDTGGLSSSKKHKKQERIDHKDTFKKKKNKTEKTQSFNLIAFFMPQYKTN